MLRRLFPHPYLTVVLTAVWVMLMNEVSLGYIVFGFLLGTIVPLLTAAYWPDRPTIRRPVRFGLYILLVLWDIVMANITVARIILFLPRSQLRPAWITVPTVLRTPEAITMLAGTITMTPGTVTSDIATDGRSLLVHCLHAPDPDAVRDGIKNRYERRLKEIFE